MPKYGTANELRFQSISMSVCVVHVSQTQLSSNCRTVSLLVDPLSKQL